jgi:hypothetical protein
MSFMYQSALRSIKRPVPNGFSIAANSDGYSAHPEKCQ